MEPSLFLLAPRKLPRQARAQATFSAIVDACGQLLTAGPYEALTTNCISERAGVSIGTLYEYFPNRESIVAALTAQSCSRLVARMTMAVEETVGLGDFAGVEHLLRAGVEALGAPENAFKALLREAPFVVGLPVFKQARLALDALSQQIREGAVGQIDLPSPQVDAWLISQMLFPTMAEIAFLDICPAERSLHIHELARLTYRMAMGCEAEEARHPAAC
jgi:AcrR family transcriptional regulator